MCPGRPMLGIFSALSSQETTTASNTTNWRSGALTPCRTSHEAILFSVFDPSKEKQMTVIRCSGYVHGFSISDCGSFAFYEMLLMGKISSCEIPGITRNLYTPRSKSIPRSNILLTIS
ncbi:hypothetical protein CPB85DRAFT_552742 [Mucidula mucida]|nr:hypothetical protein CPB85DRAFT_552742 [Mucidula mucida]